MGLSVDSETGRPEAKAEVIEPRNHPIGRVDVMVCAEDYIHRFANGKKLWASPGSENLACQI